MYNLESAFHPQIDKYITVVWFILNINTQYSLLTDRIEQDGYIIFLDSAAHPVLMSIHERSSI